MKTLIVILGPTGVGKTDLCLDIAEYYDIPIINADSRQLFKDMKIGTAAPTEQQQSRRKHYFVGTLGLTDYYNASMYEQDVISLLDKLFKEKDFAILTGGSMMYIDAVCNGIDDIPTIDDHTRALFKQKYAAEGLEPLCEELKKLDPEYYSIVDLKNTRRIIHALEICYTTGKTYTSLRKQTKRERPFRIIKVGLNREREQLYQRINKRVDDMIANGLVEEARKLYPYKELNALNTVGYKEIFEFLDGKCSLDKAIEHIKSNTRRYARKQQTWFKRDNTIQWFTPEEKEQIKDYISQLL